MQNWLVTVYKTDRRTKGGERMVRKFTLDGMTREAVDGVLAVFYPSGHRFEVVPATMKVKNLMTGEEIEIASDTPWCCNPASETYWSM